MATGTIRLKNRLALQIHEPQKRTASGQMRDVVAHQ